MKKLVYLTGIIAVASLLLGFVARLFFFDKVLLGIHALTFLRVTNTMLLFAIALLIFEYVNRK